MREVCYFIFIVLLISSFTSAQLEDLEQNLEERADKFEATLDSLPEEREDFARYVNANWLQKKWLEWAERNQAIGNLDDSFQEIRPFVNPVFRYTIGVTPSLTWLFFLSFWIWISFLIGIIGTFLHTSFTKWVALTSAFLAIVIFSLLDVARTIAEFIVNFFENVLIRIVILLLIVGFILFIAHLISRFEDRVREDQEKEQEERREEEVRSYMNAFRRMGRALTDQKADVIDLKKREDGTWGI